MHVEFMPVRFRWTCIEIITVRVWNSGERAELEIEFLVLSVSLIVKMVRVREIT